MSVNPSKKSVIHTPAMLVGEFPGLSMSHARRLLAQGAVRMNGQVVTDLDLDLDTLPGADDEPVQIEVGRDLTSEALLKVLEAGRPFCPECDLGVNACTCELDGSGHPPNHPAYDPQDFA